MSDDERLYKELGILTKKKADWEENIAYIGSLLEHQSVKITAKALWMIGEMGLLFPDKVAIYIEKIASFLESPETLLRQRALNALGRIGRGKYRVIQPFWDRMFRLATDLEPEVRLSFIWANENIATNTPEIYADCIPVFARLLEDKDRRVRMEAPELFRVLGKRTPEHVKKYIEKLAFLAEHDEEPVVRIHAKGAIKAIQGNDSSTK